MKALVQLVLAVMLAMGLMSPARAASGTGTDESGDVNMLKKREDRRAKNAPFADIVALTTNYRDDRLVLKTRFRELAATPKHVVYLGIEVLTSDGREYSGQLIYSADYGISSIDMYGVERPPSACGEKALDGRVNERTSTLVFVIPTWCLGGADWVRTGSTTMVVKDDGPYVEWRDDARMGYRIPADGQIYPVPVYGRRIARG